MKRVPNTRKNCLNAASLLQYYTLLHIVCICARCHWCSTKRCEARSLCGGTTGHKVAQEGDLVSHTAHDRKWKRSHASFMGPFAFLALFHDETMLKKRMVPCSGIGDLAPVNRCGCFINISVMLYGMLSV